MLPERQEFNLLCVERVNRVKRWTFGAFFEAMRGYA